MLRQLRENKGLTQKELAEILGVCNVVVSNYESKGRKPSLGVYRDICEYFDLSNQERMHLLEWFLESKGE